MINQITKDNMKLEKCRLFCPIERTNAEMFFSLVGYRNNYFTSDDPNRIIEFYKGFENRDQLIQWMKERPKGVANIHEVEGDKDIIVVIPTADFNGKYAKECRENIFKGLHMVFVESGGRGDFYFNIAHNYNVGIKKAMEYNPKWVVVSNDDMYKVDDIMKLKSCLKKLPSDEQSVVFSCKESAYHSRFVSISFRTYRRKVMIFLLGKLERNRLLLEKKFKIRYVVGSTIGLYKLIYKPRIQFKYTGSFAVFSIGLVKKYSGVMFDENYVNGTEDLDQSLRFVQENIDVKCVQYDIGDYVGGTIGPYNTIRRLRGLINDTYFNLKIELGELKFDVLH